MRFHLVYQGPLPSSGNSSKKPGSVVAIRKALSPQIEYLWKTHNALQTLLKTGAKRITGTSFGVSGPPPTPRQMAERFPDHFEDCCRNIDMGGKWYMPLVRQSLNLACELDILFLRQQDPGVLVSQGGDIDNRIKVLLDALRMPERDEHDRDPPEGAGLFTLMQSDTLITRLNVDTDRLLTPQTDKPHEVNLVIAVKVNVLQVGERNMCLL
jgi:hypothetical protein